MKNTTRIRLGISTLIALLGALVLINQPLHANQAWAAPLKKGPVEIVQDGDAAPGEVDQEQEAEGEYVPKLFFAMNAPEIVQVGEIVELTFTLTNHPLGEVELQATPSAQATPESGTQISREETGAIPAQGVTSDEWESARRALLLTFISAVLIGLILGGLLSLLPRFRLRVMITASLLISLMAAMLFALLYQRESVEVITARMQARSSPMPPSQPSPSPTPTESPEARMVRLFGDESPVRDITITSDLVDTPTYVSGDDDDDDTLEVGEIWLYTASYEIPPSGFNPQLIPVTVVGVDLEGDLVTSENTFPLNVDYTAAFSIESNAYRTASVGASLTYTYTLTYDSNSSDGSPVFEIGIRDEVGGSAAYLRGDENDNLALDPEETWIYSLTYTVPGEIGDPFESQVTAQGQDGDGDPVVASIEYALDLVFEPELILELAAPGEVNVGEVITYTINLTNDTELGDGSPINIQEVEHSQVGSATYVRGDADDDGLLDRAEVWVYTASYTVSPFDEDPLESQVVVTAFDQEDDPVDVNLSYELNVIYNPSLQVTLSGPDSVNLGGIVRYTVSLSTDPVAGDGSPIRDLELESAYGGEANYTEGDIDQDGLLEIDEIWTYEITYRLADSSDLTITNSLTASGEDLDEDPVSASDSHTLKVVHNPVIRVARSSPLTAMVGQSVVYTIRVTNDAALGDGTPVSNLRINDSRLGTPGFVGGDSNDNQILEIDETWVYTTSYTVQASDPDPLTSITTARGEDLGGEVVEGNTEVPNLDIINNPAISLEWSGPESARFGEQSFIVFEVTNDDVEGDGTGVLEISVNDDNLGAAEYQQGDLDDDGLLEPGETWVYHAAFNPTPQGPDPLESQASASGVDRDGDSVRAASPSYSMDVFHDPGLSLEINAPSSSSVGEQVNFEILVSNNTTSGDGSPVQEVSLETSLPGELTFTGGDSLSDEILGEDETWSYTLDYTVQPSDPDPLENQISVSGLDLDGEGVQESSEYSLEVEYNPVIGILQVDPVSVTLEEEGVQRVQITLGNDGAAGDGSPVQNLVVERQPGGQADYITGDTDEDGMLESGETWTYAINLAIDMDNADVLEGEVAASGEDLDSDEVSALVQHDLRLVWLFTNGDFEAGAAGWRLVDAGLPVSLIDSSPEVDTEIPIGEQGVLLGKTDYLCNPTAVPVGYAAIQKRITVPDAPPSQSVSLRFLYVIYSQDTSLESTYDRFEVHVDGDVAFFDGNQVNTGLGCGQWWRVPGDDNPRAGETDGWAVGSIDLDEYRGETIFISFENHNRFDGWYNTYTYLDNVELIIEEGG